MKIKISFLGDVTCDRPMLKASNNRGVYEFDRSLEKLQCVVSDSDYVVANLETVFAGAKYGYNPKPITYSSPDALAAALKNAGISMVTTANNHCLDMGGKGIDRTIEVLDACGMEHTGTVRSGRENVEKRYLVKELGGIRIAFVSLTDSLNTRANGTAHSESEWSQVNHLRTRKASISGNPMKELLKRILPMEQIEKLRAARKRKQGIALVSKRVDDFDIPAEDRPQIAWAIELLKQAKQESDFVVACIHAGGQFNYEPGRHSVQLYDMLEPYADAMIGHHPHVIQRVEQTNGKIRAYSLGGVNMSESADYVAKDTDFQYSLVLHLTIEKEKDATKITNVEYSVLKACEDASHYVMVRLITPDDQRSASRIEEITAGINSMN